jgi:hypothetical protein
MDEKEFTRLYIIQFLAAYAATNYHDACSTGNWKSLFPVEDAEELAKKAWAELRDKTNGF